MIELQSTPAQRLSCACLMILGDVEPTIRSCMDSVLFSGCFDEYVIVQDARTSDNTPRILEDYRRVHPNIRILWHDWRSENFANPRNKGLHHAGTQYGFWIDGDEMLMDAGGIYHILQNPLGQAYHIWQIGPDPFGGIVRTHQLRLFPIRPGIRWELPVHEQLAFSIRRLGVKEKLTPYRVWHMGYHSEAGNAAKHKRYSDIMRTWLKRNKAHNSEREYIKEQFQSSMSYLNPYK